VSVWKEGIGFELVENPAAVGIPPTPVSVRTAIEIDEAIRERTERTAQRGAGIAAEAGFAQPDGLAVADELDVPVAETIADVARKHDAQAIVVGAHGQGRVSEVVLGSVSRDVVRRATCPVVVVREAPAT
jgi:nucleotide-binding universal stress UspA family protein